ncbi:MAG: hypothetical protein ACRDI2_20775, partial [Chloroflexota bacterium]
GQARLVVAVDAARPDITRLLGFVSQHTDLDVRLVAVSKYVDETGAVILVPNFLVYGGPGGGTGAGGSGSFGGAESKGGGVRWSEGSFVEQLTATHGAEQAEAARRIHDWALCRRLRIIWHKYARDGAFSAQIEGSGTVRSLCVVAGSGNLQLDFPSIRKQPPFDTEEARGELLQRLNQALPGIHLDRVVGWPNVPLTRLTDEATLKKLLGVLDWVVDSVQEAGALPAPAA